MNSGELLIWLALAIPLFAAAATVAVGRMPDVRETITFLATLGLAVVAISLAIRTGEGAEGQPTQFLPIHAAHLAVFVALSWISAGYLGLVLGTWLMGYMSYFVGSYAVAAQSPLIGPLIAWVPWSVLRVLAFVLLGCLFARPLLMRRPWPFGSTEKRLLALAVAGLLADVGLKALMANSYGLLLRRFAEGL